MKIVIILIVALTLLIQGAIATETDCAVCTMLIGVIEANYQNNPNDTDSIVDGICKLFSRVDNGALTRLCEDTWHVLEPFLFPLIEKLVPPDEVCRKIGYCSKWPQCTLYTKWPSKQRHPEQFRAIKNVPQVLMKLFKDGKGMKSFSKIFLGKDGIVWPWDKVANHLPASDHDNDKFSTEERLRGTNWRGKDCNDGDANIYPGRGRESSQNPNFDSNCNGIYGINPKTNHSYEDDFCGASGAMGVIVLGDSASAHFHLPADATADQLGDALEDELDFPQCSWSTGHDTTPTCPYSPLSTGVNSIYLRMRERNRCNHRDYQNISVNGARSSPMGNVIINTTARTLQDKPAIVFYALVGNDVCDHEPGNHSLVPPHEFHMNILHGLDYLERTLPNNSHVVFVGLEHGEMWDIMANRSYPNNTLGGDIIYSQLWDYLNCLNISPCFGWLNSNATQRNVTVWWAQQLDNELIKIAATNKNYTKFDLTYIENPDAINTLAWVNSGGQAHDMLEWVGGGHPSQLQHEMTANYIWNQLVTNFSHVIGPVNPFNSQIESIFGNQGGY
eukprot:TRINITY_DN3815_c0_g1_i1.p1 TRINITY_DN3815_c0_g1~~TRINITY_DN3815_c0_g1_i1.p1  ORF type:complete len:559 (+),score=123.51 TRINITY_DN3815_c0_g1_i1:470-2146(+)